MKGFVFEASLLKQLTFHLLYLFGAALSLQTVHPAASVQLFTEHLKLSFSVLHLGPDLLKSLSSVQVQLLPTASVLRRLLPDRLQLLAL